LSGATDFADCRGKKRNSSILGMSIESGAEETMTMRPDPTLHATAKLAMQAPPEKFAYTVMLSPDFSQPDGLAIVNVDAGSTSFGKIVHTVIMPHKGDEFHHFVGTPAPRRCLRLEATLSWSGAT
jgi:hypothetical protein